MFTPFALGALGDTAQLAGQWQVAEQHYATAIALAEQFGLRRALVQTQFSLGEVREAQGRHDEELALYKQSYASARSIGFAAGAARIGAKLRELGHALDEDE